jgi:hypothetical protein
MPELSDGRRKTHLQLRIKEDKSSVQLAWRSCAADIDELRSSRGERDRRWRVGREHGDERPPSPKFSQTHRGREEIGSKQGGARERAGRGWRASR